MPRRVAGDRKALLLRYLRIPPSFFLLPKACGRVLGTPFGVIDIKVRRTIYKGRVTWKLFTKTIIL